MFMAKRIFIYTFVSRKVYYKYPIVIVNVGVSDLSLLSGKKVFAYRRAIERRHRCYSAHLSIWTCPEDSPTPFVRSHRHTSSTCSHWICTFCCCGSKRPPRPRGRVLRAIRALSVVLDNLVLGCYRCTHSNGDLW